MAARPEAADHGRHVPGDRAVAILTVTQGLLHPFALLDFTAQLGVGLFQGLGTFLDPSFQAVVGLLHPVFSTLAIGDVMGHHHRMGDFAQMVVVGVVGDLIATQLPAVEFKPIFGTGDLPGKTNVELGLDDLVELGLAPDLGHGLAHQVIPSLAPGTAIGLIDAFVGIVAIDHGEQLVGDIGDELDLAPCLPLFLQGFQLLAKRPILCG